jgi:hypothetical protein
MLQTFLALHHVSAKGVTMGTGITYAGLDGAQPGVLLRCLGSEDSEWTSVPPYPHKQLSQIDTGDLFYPIALVVAI